MTQSTCPVDGCPKEVLRKGYCYAHYMKQWRYGTPTPTFPPRWKDLAGMRFGTLTPVERTSRGEWMCVCDCGEEVTRRSGTLNKHGDGNTCGRSGRHYYTDTPGYAAAHGRVRFIHGAASSHACRDCGQSAYHWSYDHEDPDELYFEYKPGKFAAYSADPARYVPRCVPCHKRYDLDRRDARVIA